MRPSQDGRRARVVDITDCDKEPIHAPGSVQAHGSLFVLGEPDLEILRVSANTGESLGAPHQSLLGTGFDLLVDPGQRAGVREWLSSPRPEDANPVRLRVGAGEERETFDALAHRHDGTLIVELENRREGDGGPSPDYSRDVRRAMGRLRSSSTLREFCSVAAAETRLLTGFDRVTVYRFDRDWHGEVYAEDKREGLGALLGLHFPASDIPEQARRLYHLNRIRLIADTRSPPVPVVPGDAGAGRPPDLSLAALRSVSPVHVQYLENMGARTSMSISLMRDGRLWGLLSCMQYGEPRYVPPATRAACELLGDLMSAQLAVKEEGEGMEYRSRLQAVRERLLHRMAEETDLARALLDPVPGPDMLLLTAARGAAVVHDGACASFGAAPGAEQVKRLVAWLRVHSDAEVFHTDSLPRLFPEAEEYKATAAGLVAINTTKAEGHYVLWFRPEVTQTVDWGGDPHKPAGDAVIGGRLTPRKSFELWKEVVHLKSLPWQAAEVEAARALRGAIIAVVVRRAEELTRLNAELARSNSDLDAFAFTTSHDLKEPLRGIHNYATFLLEDYGDKLDAEGVARLQALGRLSLRMEELVEAMLRFSRLGRAELTLAPADLNDVVREAADDNRVLIEEGGAELRVPRPLPSVRCDRALVCQVFANLVANAVKYNDRPDKWVEVGFTDPARPDGSAERRGLSPVFYVADNGVGIPEKHRHAVFRLFKRLHAQDKYGGGTGAGLTFVKKIVERHGGSVWIEPRDGGGTTFRFTLGG